MPVKVLVSDPVSSEGLNLLREAEGFEVDEKTGLTEEELIQIIDQYDALIVRSQTQVTARIIEKADRLQIIGRAGVGVDNIDIAAATAKGIMVVNAPDGNTISTAEHTFSMLMALARNIPQAYLKLKQHVWDRKAFVGVELNEKTLGIIGLGRIGTEVAKRAKAFNMKVIAYDPYLTAEKAEKLGIQAGTLDDVIRTADFITVHTPLLKETKHMISTEQFKQMKDGVYILNCARGGIIDEDALYEAIVSGKVAGAALDVFEEEPATHHRLLELDQVIATPHLGASTKEAQISVSIIVCQEILNVFQGKPVKNAVNLPPIPAHLLTKLEPYFVLSEQLGSFAAQAVKGVIKEINISYAGELTEIDVSPLTRKVIKGVLSYRLGQQVNDVNAPYLAKQRDLVINEQKTSISGGFTNLINVELVTTEQKKRVAGTLLNGYGARIVKVDHYSIDVEPTGHLLYVHHNDRPGVIGRVGTLLGNGDINIATMQVGRSDRGGDAIMMLSVDKPASQEVLKQMAQMPEIKSVIEIDL